MAELATERHGQGPLLLLLHGWAMHGGVFAPLIAALSRRFTVLAVDLPGHGHSRQNPLPLTLDAVADALALLLRKQPEVLRGEAPILAGWSLGGLFALACAARHPDLLRGLVMLAASPRFVAADDWPQGMDPRIFERFGEELDRDYAGTLDRFLLLEAQGAGRSREELRFLREVAHARGKPDPHALRAGLQLLQASDLRALLPGLPVPSLWLAGGRDRLVAAAALQAAARLAPAGRCIVCAHAAHAPFLSDPAAVADALVAFDQYTQLLRVDQP